MLLTINKSTDDTDDINQFENNFKNINFRRNATVYTKCVNK